MRRALAAWFLAGVVVLALGCGNRPVNISSSGIEPRPSPTLDKAAAEAKALVDYLTAVQPVLASGRREHRLWVKAHKKWNQTDFATWPQFGKVWKAYARVAEGELVRLNAIQAPAFLAKAHAKLIAEEELVFKESVTIAEHLRLQDPYSRWAAYWENAFQRTTALYASWRIAVLAQAARLHTRPPYPLSVAY